MDQRRADDLAPIYARLAAQDTEIAAQRSQIARLKRRRRLPSRALPLLLAALLVALVPLATLAATPFTDLTGGPHDGNIDLIFNAGITKGCDATSYCPTGNVTREEMASFLARTAGLGTNPPVVNAARLGGQPAAAYARTAQFVAFSDAPIAAGSGSTASFSTAGGDLLVFVSGSVRRKPNATLADGPAGVVVKLDGATAPGGTSTIDFQVDPPSAVKAYPAIVVHFANVPAGVHSITVETLPGASGGAETHIARLELPRP